jgi:hypothetical protein
MALILPPINAGYFQSFQKDIFELIGSVLEL